MLGHMHNLKDDDSNIWIFTGTGKKQRYIDLTKVYEYLGPSLCRSLPGFHTLTGCDYNPAFFKKGKQRPFNILKKKHEYRAIPCKRAWNLVSQIHLQINIYNKQYRTLSATFTMLLDYLMWMPDFSCSLITTLLLRF